jgi:nicotinamide mononucleotide adenylyltransferase
MKKMIEKILQKIADELVIQMGMAKTDEEVKKIFEVAWTLEWYSMFLFNVELK